MELGVLLAATVRARASDLFLKCDAPPAFRVDGLLRRDVLAESERSAPLDAAFLEKALQTVLDAHDREAFDKEGEADAAYDLAEVGRFRVNAFRQRGKVGIVFRHIPRTIPSLAELNLPAAQIQKLCSRQRGLVLVTGVAGSGKSTCLAPWWTTSIPRRAATSLPSRTPSSSFTRTSCRSSSSANSTWTRALSAPRSSTASVRAPTSSSSARCATATPWRPP